MHRRIPVVAALIIAIFSALPTGAQGRAYAELSWEEEIRLAMSAGPLTVSENADVYVMGEHGFELAFEGDNGFSCLVVRVAGDPRQVAPHCFNPAATDTALPAYLREGELQAQGLSADEIRTRMEHEWEDGSLPLPEGPAYAYMMSEGQRLGPNAAKFKPHFMLYVPYVTNQDIGGSLERQAYPFVGPFEDHPLSTVVIIMPEFVTPESVVIPSR